MTLRHRLAFIAFLLFVVTDALGKGAPSTVVVRAESAHLEGLADRTAEEIELLLRPQTEPWTVRRDSGDEWTDATIAVSVGAVTGPREASVPRVRVDPVGRTGSTESDDGGRLVVLESFASAIERDLGAFRDLLEAVNSDPRPVVEILLEPSLHDLAATVAEAAEQAKTQVHIRPVENLEIDRLDPFPDGPVYLPPGSGVDGARWARELVARGIPGFSGRGPSDVEVGWFAARSVRRNERLARLAALEVLGIVRGLPRASPTEEEARGPAVSARPMIHRGTAAALGLGIPWRLRLSAEWVGEEEKTSADPTLTPEAARLEAVEANLDLRARDLLTAAGEEEVQRALAALRPRLDVGVEATWADEETARASFGARPERLVTAVGEAGWILFSEDARAAVDGSRRFQAVRELELRELELDIGLEAAAGLLGIARARAFEAAEAANLESTLADLESTRSRRSAGVAGRADVARLEARAARDRRSRVAAYGDRRAAEIRLNRLLSRPLDGEILPSLGDGVSFESAPLPEEEVILRPAALASLGEEMLRQAKERAPEIAAADEIVRAREREVLAAGRAFYLPVLEAFGSVQNRLEEGGAGTGPPPLAGALAGALDPPDTSWTLGLGARLSLFDGGARDARRARARLDLEAARLLRAAAEQGVEARLRLALIRLETSYESAVQARLAADAAARAFDVVRDAYGRGAVSLTTLLDAQSELLAARRARAAAAAEALVRRFEVYRAIGGFPETEAPSPGRAGDPP